MEADCNYRIDRNPVPSLCFIKAQPVWCNSTYKQLHEASGEFDEYDHLSQQFTWVLSFVESKNTLA